MNSAQRNYCPTRRELLAVIAALQHFRHYLLGTHTDHHSLKWLKTFKRSEGILARWIKTLAEFDNEIEHRLGRLHCNVDGVSRTICNNARTSERHGSTNLNVRMNSQLLSAYMHCLSRLKSPSRSLANCSVRIQSFLLCWLSGSWCHSYSRWPPRFAIRISQSLATKAFDSPRWWYTHSWASNAHSTSYAKYIAEQSVWLSSFRSSSSPPRSGTHVAKTPPVLLLARYATWCIHLDITMCTMSKSKPAPSRAHGHLQKVVTGAPLDIVAEDILSGLHTASDGS